MPTHAIAVNEATADPTTGNIQNIDIATGNANYHVIAGDADMNGVATEFVVAPSQVSLYAQNDGAVFSMVEAYGNGSVNIRAQDAANTTHIVVQPAAATINGKTIAAVRPEDGFADDAAAAAGGIEVGQFYHTAGALKVRLV